MGIELVTGFTGKAHISSLDVAKFNAGALGPGEYVFAGVKDDKLKATMASSNKVHISSGNAMMQGRHFWVDAAGVDLTVQTGTQSQKRNDLVVARYAKNASTGVESVSLVVIKGTPTTGTPADPSYTRGDILNGNALTNDMPLWRIPLNGITVGTPVQLFQEFTSAKDAWNSVSQAAVGNWATLQTYGKIAVLDVELIITGTMQPWQTLENSCRPASLRLRLRSASWRSKATERRLLTSRSKDPGLFCETGALPPSRCRRREPMLTAKPCFFWRSFPYPR